jgi:hypothetical protein
LERQTALRGRAELLLALTSDPSEGLGEELLEDAIMEETKGGEEDGIPEADAAGDSSSSRSVVRKSTADLVQELMETRSQLPADLTRVTNQRRTCTPADAELLSSLAGMARGDQMLAESEEMNAPSDEVEEEDTSPLRGKTASSTRSRISTKSTQVIQLGSPDESLVATSAPTRVGGLCDAGAFASLPPPMPLDQAELAALDADLDLALEATAASMAADAADAADLQVISHHFFLISF